MQGRVMRGRAMHVHHLLVLPLLVALLLEPDDLLDGSLQVKNDRKNVKSAPYRPILSANRTMQRPAHVYAHVDPAQNSQKGPK